MVLPLRLRVVRRRRSKQTDRGDRAMSLLVSAEQALNLVVQAHMQEFHAKFNECMKDPKFVKEWRCGGGGESFWRFSFQSNHNEATSHEIGLQLAQVGWKVREVNRVFDREHYTCYIVVKGDNCDSQQQAPVVAAVHPAASSDAEKLKQACWLHLNHAIHRYLISNADGRENPGEKAEQHLVMSYFYVAMHKGLEIEDVRLDHHDANMAVHDHTQSLNSYLDEQIGFPLRGWPDYDDLAPKFFERFHALAMEALAGLPE